MLPQKRWSVQKHQLLDLQQRVSSRLYDMVMTALMVLIISLVQVGCDMEQNPQSVRQNNFPRPQTSQEFLLPSENLSAPNDPGAAMDVACGDAVGLIAAMNTANSAGGGV